MNENDDILNEDSIVIPKISKCDVLISQTVEAYTQQYKDCKLHLSECIPTLRKAFEIKENWEKDVDINGRECVISFSTYFTGTYSGFDIIMRLGKSDSFKDISPFLRPFKYNSPVNFKKYEVDNQNGLINLTYKIKDTDRTVLLQVNTGVSQTCKRVQVGVKTIEQPIYETKCDDSIESPSPLIDNIDVSLLGE